MRLEVKSESNMGTLVLNNIAMEEDVLEMFIDVVEVSDSLREVIETSIDAEKWNVLDEKRYSGQYKWSDKPVILDCVCLILSLKADKKNRYSILVGFHDANNDMLEGSTNIPLDMSENERVLQGIVNNYITSKFFS